MEPEEISCESQVHTTVLNCSYEGLQSVHASVLVSAWTNTVSCIRMSHVVFESVTFHLFYPKRPFN